MIRGSANIFVAGAGIYSWFSTYAQDCIDQHACQKVLVLLEENYSNVRVQHLITIGTKYMAVMDGVGISATDYLNVETHPRWSQISVLDVSGNGTGELSDMIWIDPKIWEMEQPSFTCSPPCLVKLPPWTGATSVVDYPRITVTDGAWSTTITRAPVTISQWIFEPATLIVGSGSKLRRRQGFQEFWPTPATRPSWPAVTYIGQNGLAATTAPSIPFPTPPASIGPGAAAPPKGSWPKRAVQPVAGLINQPIVKPCFFWDPFCEDPWGFGEMPDPEDPYDERGPEDDVICPEEEGEEESTTTSTTKATSTTSQGSTPTSEQEQQPTESPYEHADPMKNKRDCYDGGRKASHEQLDNSIRSFCNSLGKPGTVYKDSVFRKSNLELPNGGGGPGLVVVATFELFEGCEWTWNFDECARYLRVPVDSCNCGGTDGKQGGTVKNNCFNWRLDPNNKW